MLERVAQHLDEEHSKTVNVDDVYYAAQLLSLLMATYDGLTVNLPIDLRLAAVIKMNLCTHTPPTEWLEEMWIHILFSLAWEKLSCRKKLAAVYNVSHFSFSKEMSPQPCSFFY